MRVRDVIYAELEAMTARGRKELLCELWEDVYEQEPAVLSWVRCRLVELDEREAEGIAAHDKDDVGWTDEP